MSGYIDTMYQYCTPQYLCGFLRGVIVCPGIIKHYNALFSEKSRFLDNKAFSFLGICGRFKSFSGRFAGICGRFEDLCGRFNSVPLAYRDCGIVLIIILQSHPSMYLCRRTHIHWYILYPRAFAKPLCFCVRCGSIPR